VLNRLTIGYQKAYKPIFRVIYIMGCRAGFGHHDAGKWEMMKETGGLTRLSEKIAYKCRIKRKLPVRRHPGLPHRGEFFWSDTGVFPQDFRPEPGQ
jgi:hypothetical protein